MHRLKSKRYVALLVVAALLPVGMLRFKSSESGPSFYGLKPVEPAPEGYTDCVAALQIGRRRGLGISNVHRFGAEDPTVRYSARISDLTPDTLKGYCDWEACLWTNGYAHANWVDDAGIERWRVCDADAGDTCDGFPMDQAACVAQATMPGRASCHVGLLQDCLIQRAIRGFADARVTEACRLSAQACTEQLPGDLTEKAQAAKQETDQVAIERALCELQNYTPWYPSDPVKPHWLEVLSGWKGGLPADALDCAKEMLDAGADDASPDDASDASDDAPDE
ncbi:MAG: hypothetical protein FWD69_17850 [Polyangiaceae bacterium]|nr:hypothetical protein [Polyangiaceae bacterium]